tara:strand:+ start:203 stop:391 length:189 start_codon:yes stop_codon:yes gene_type:complete
MDWINGETKTKTWNTKELQEDFEVHSFGYGFCIVTRKSDRVKGSLNFDHMPRKYFDFVEVPI